MELVVAVAPPVATITINRPEKRNALTLGLWAELGAAVEALDHDAEVAVIILTGAGDAFCAGFDLSDLSSEDDASRARRMSQQSRHVGMLPPHDTPIIAAVNGPAITGGLELALSCDILVASDAARFADTHAKVGAIPGGGLTITLPRRIGPGRARLLSLTGDMIDASTALAWGLADEVVGPDRLLDRCGEIATSIAKKPPGVFAAIRQLYARNADRSDEAAFAEEQATSRAWMAGQFDRRRLAEERTSIIDEGAGR